jgi:hypothetical protein
MNRQEREAFKAGFADGMRLGIIFLASIAVDLAAALLINLLVFGPNLANASIHPGNEPIAILPQPLADAQQPKPRCVRLRTTIVTVHLANGAVLIAPMTIAVPC